MRDPELYSLPVQSRIVGKIRMASMTRTVISRTDLKDKASEIVERVRHGEMAVVESSGEAQIVLLDAADFRLLQALAACATESAEPTEALLSF